jgi:hypothetical protein
MKPSGCGRSFGSAVETAALGPERACAQENTENGHNDGARHVVVLTIWNAK